MKQQQPLRRVGQMLAGDDNPLRRPVDKLESAIITGLVVAFLIAAPLLAIFAVRAAGAATASEMRAERDWKPVTVVLRQSAAEGAIGLDGDLDTAWVTAQWTMPGGMQKNGLVPVALNARAGQRMAAWVTPAGQLTPPPLTKADLTDRTATAAVAFPAGLAVVLAIAAGATRVVANRRRAACWGREWEATGPRWSSLR